MPCELLHTAGRFIAIAAMAIFFCLDILLFFFCVLTAANGYYLVIRLNSINIVFFIGVSPFIHNYQHKF